MKKERMRSIGTQILITFVIAAILGAKWAFSVENTTGYKTYSPDKQYSVYAKAYNYEKLLPTMPGGSGDASGIVYLFDERQKKILQSTKIPMVSIVHQAMWQEDSVDIPFIFHWTLPNKVQSSSEQ